MEVLYWIGTTFFLFAVAYFLGRSDMKQELTKDNLEGIEDARKLKEQIKDRISKLSDDERANLLREYTN